MSSIGMVNKSILEALKRAGAYIPENTRVASIARRYTSRQATAASITAGTVLSFFGPVPASGVTPYTTNFPANGMLNAGEFFHVQGFSLRWVPGINPDSLVYTGTAGNDRFSGNSSAQTGLQPDTLHENMRLIGEAGVVRLRYDGVDWIDEVGISQWPAGRGVDGYSALGDLTSGNLLRSTGSAHHGVPHVENFRKLGGGFLLVGGQSLQCTVTFPTALTMQVSGYIEAALIGRLLTSK